jgi:hypothetical protein
MEKEKDDSSSSEEESDQQAAIYSNYVNLAAFVSQRSLSAPLARDSNAIFIPSSYSNNYSYGSGASVPVRSESSTANTATNESPMGAQFPLARLGHSVDWNKDYQVGVSDGVDSVSSLSVYSGFIYSPVDCFFPPAFSFL